MSFQETSIEDILSPSNPGSQQETVSQAVALQLMESTNVALEESELAGEWLLVQEQGWSTLNWFSLFEAMMYNRKSCILFPG